jgi:DNA-binding Lrp family transcriptional regulator
MNARLARPQKREHLARMLRQIAHGSARAARRRRKDGETCISISLRRYHPDQVRWVGAKPLSPEAGHPNEIANGNLCACRRAFKPLPRARDSGPLAALGPPEARMIPFFVQIKCQLGKSYEVANRLADSEIASEIYSTAGEFDLLIKFYVDDGTDIGHFVNEKVQTIPGIQETRTIITFKAF